MSALIIPDGDLNNDAIVIPATTPSGGGGGTVTSITATAPIVVTPNPLVGVGVVSHAASGVVAATYGDASHYAVVTVDVNGHVTAASQVAASGGAGSFDWGKYIAGKGCPI